MGVGLPQATEGLGLLAAQSRPRSAAAGRAWGAATLVGDMAQQLSHACSQASLCQPSGQEGGSGFLCSKEANRLRGGRVRGSSPEVNAFTRPC